MKNLSQSERLSVDPFEEPYRFVYSFWCAILYTLISIDVIVVLIAKLNQMC